MDSNHVASKGSGLGTRNYFMVETELTGQKACSSWQAGAIMENQAP
jgi:hypothetical protein